MNLTTSSSGAGASSTAVELSTVEAGAFDAASFESPNSIEDTAEHPLKTISEPNNSRTSFAIDFIRAPTSENDIFYATR